MNENQNQNQSDIPDQDSVFSAPVLAGKNPQSRGDQKKSRAKRKKRNRNRILWILLAVIAVLALVYWLVILPLTKEPGEQQTDPLDLLEGEAEANGRILIFPHYERSEIESVEIHNESGKYTVCRDASGTFVLNGFEQLTLEPNALSGIIVGAGYPITMERIVDHCKDFSEYGLADEQGPSYYVLKTLDGHTYTVYIGDRLLSAAGYYVKASDRDSVYVLATSLVEPLLQDKESMVSLQITSDMSSTNAVLEVTEFEIQHSGEPFVKVRRISDEEKDAYGLNINYIMDVPAEYPLSTDNYSDSMVAIAEMNASRIVALGLTRNRMEEYGLSDSDTVRFIYKGEENTLRVAKQLNANGNYYVAALNYDLIAEVPAESLAFMAQDLIHWVDKYSFMININTVAEMHFESDRVNETFFLEGEGQELVVTASNGYQPEVSNFRQFYKTLLSSNIQGYSELSEEEIASLADKQPQLVFSYKTRAGKEMTYRFYEISERKSVYTLDGAGGVFYVYYTQVNKISSDCIRIMNGEQVDSDDRS